MEVKEDVIRDALIHQERDKEEYLKQEYVERDFTMPKSKLAKVIMGPRRAGKTFFLIHYLNNITHGKFGYINFDDEVLSKVDNFNVLIDTYNKVQKHKTILLDEVQNLEKWELLVNKLLRKGYDVYITGSNSKILSKELATLLTGRHISRILLTFSFKEFLLAKHKKIDKLTKTEILLLLKEYMETGGYPEIVINNEPFKEYISSLFSSILFNDIVKRYNVRDVMGLESLAVFLLTNIGAIMSYNNLTKYLKTLSINTVKNYVMYLEQAFVIGKLDKYSKKTKFVFSTPFKIYAVDLSFHNLKTTSLSHDESKKMENLVYTHLLRKFQFHELFYYKTKEGYEVDFLIKEGNKIKELIQVSYANSYEEIKEREIRALLHAKEDLNLREDVPLTVITWDYEDEKEVEWWRKKGRIRFIPLWKWLLEKV